MKNLCPLYDLRNLGLVYALVNVGRMLVSVLLQRRVLITFGTIGVLMYLGRLAYQVFQDAFVFPMALSLLGVFIIFVAVQAQKHRSAIDRQCNAWCRTQCDATSPRAE
jgi:hypothetical protein